MLQSRTRLNAHVTHSRGFTLIEILIVVVILGILAAIIIPQFSESAETAQTSAAKSSVKTVQGQVELYKFKNGGAIPSFADLEDGYLVNFTQPDGYCISISPAGEVTLTPGNCS